MAERVFLDTNVVLYAVSGDPDEIPKRDVAQVILERSDLVISTQVVQEFYTRATKPTRFGRLSHEDGWMFAEGLMAVCQIVPTTEDLCRRAWMTSQRFQIHYWDAAILEAAREAGCHTLLSEDLNHNQDYGGVRVVNPFV